MKARYAVVLVIVVLSWRALRQTTPASTPAAPPAEAPQTATAVTGTAASAQVPEPSVGQSTTIPVALTSTPAVDPTEIAGAAPQAVWQVETLLVAPGEPGRLYALLKDSSGPLWAFPASSPSGTVPSIRLMISDDFAVTWVPFPGGLPVPADCMVNVNLDYTTADALYASTCQGLYVWDPQGKTWAKRSDRLTNVVAVAYGQPESVWAAALGDGVIRSSDGGKTWQDASTGLITFGGMANLGFDPRDNSTLYGIIRPQYAGSYLRRGTADGRWQTMPTPLDNTTIETGMTVDGGTGALYVTTQVPPPGFGGHSIPTPLTWQMSSGSWFMTLARTHRSACWPRVGAAGAGDLCQHVAADGVCGGRRQRRQPGASSLAGRRADVGAIGDAVGP